MADPRAGRASSSGYSPRLGRRDPRLRTNQSGLVTDSELEPGILERTGAGRTRISALDGIQPLDGTAATLEDVCSRLNLIVRLLQGR